MGDGAAELHLHPGPKENGRHHRTAGRELRTPHGGLRFDDETHRDHPLPGPLPDRTLPERVCPHRRDETRKGVPPLFPARKEQGTGENGGTGRTETGGGGAGKGKAEMPRTAHADAGGVAEHHADHTLRPGTGNPHAARIDTGSAHLRFPRTEAAAHETPRHRGHHAPTAGHALRMGLTTGHQDARQLAHSQEPGNGSGNRSGTCPGA